MHLNAYKIRSEGAEQPAAPGSALLGLPGSKKDWTVGELQIQPWVCTLKITADGNLPPEQQGRSDCSSVVLQISWKDYVLPGPAPGTAPQFISQGQVPAHRSKADTIEQLFFSY